jgi:hypothetical protein
MKCVCGYEKDSFFNNHTCEMEYLGNDDFIAFDVDCENDWNTVGIFRTEQVRFYACPKCGTLKIDI